MALSLEPTTSQEEQGIFSFAVIENGEEMGNLRVRLVGNKLFVQKIILFDSTGRPLSSQGAGVRRFREILEILKEEFPQAQTLSGTRTSGAGTRGFGEPGGPVGRPTEMDI